MQRDIQVGDTVTGRDRRDRNDYGRVLDVQGGRALVAWIGSADETEFPLVDLIHQDPGTWVWPANRAGAAGGGSDPANRAE